MNPSRLTISRLSLGALCVAVALGVWVRCSALGAAGFAEDEIDIVRATQSYARLDFSANAEHPMLAKLAAFASVTVAGRWNHAPFVSYLQLPRVSPETALRLPSAFVGGALTTIAIFLLCLELFPGTAVAPWAAFLWAVDVNAIAVNRTAKEDTFFLFFFLCGAWLYARAKRIGTRMPATGLYTASGAAFGLMLACKYMPHYYGLHALYVWITDPHPGSNRPSKLRHYGAIVVAFFVTNFAIVLPSSWERLSQYLTGRTPIHTGYMFAHQLYVNSVTVTPGGPPVTFYAGLLATKVPVLLLIAIAFGLWQLVARRTEKGFVFLRVFLVFIFVPYSLLGAKFVRYALPLFAIVDMIAAAGIVWMVGKLRRIPTPVLRRASLAATAAVFVAATVYAAIAARPYFSLTQNAIGTALFPPGYLYADDEFDDVQVREAVAAIARIAEPGAVIASDATTVVQEYLNLAGRRDIQSISLSRNGLPPPIHETWVIAQDGHTYFENAPILDQVKLQPPVRVWWVNGVVAVRLYELSTVRDVRLGIND